LEGGEVDTIPEIWRGVKLTQYRRFGGGEVNTIPEIWRGVKLMQTGRGRHVKGRKEGWRDRG